MKLLYHAFNSTSPVAPSLGTMTWSKLTFPRLNILTLVRFVIYKYTVPLTEGSGSRILCLSPRQLTLFDIFKASPTSLFCL